MGVGVSKCGYPRDVFVGLYYNRPTMYLQMHSEKMTPWDLTKVSACL